MDLLGYIIEYMNNKVGVASPIFKSVYGLCEFIKAEGNYYTYKGGGQGVPVTNYDNVTGTILWLKRSSVTFGDAPQLLRDTGCADYYTITYPLRAVCVVRKKDLPCDNATSVDQVAQDMLTKLSGKDKVLRSAIGASYVDVLPRGYSALDNITKNMNYACVGVDYDVQVSIKKSCIPQICEDVPLPTCEFSVTLNNVNGLTIYTITQDSANPFTLASQQIIDGYGNLISVPYNPSVPYVTEACPVSCDDAEAVLKNTAGTTISTTSIPSGGSDDIIAPDATAVLKDTAGNILDTEAIPSNVSEDIIAPDGNITVNGVAFDTVLSGGTTDVEVRRQTGSTQVGSKQGQYWRIDDSDISINGTPFDSVAAEASIDIDVQYENGTPVGSDVSGVWTIPNPVQDLVTRVDFDAGVTPLEYTITVDSYTAGTYTVAAFDGSISSATYEVNGSPATLPITVVATDTLKIVPDVDDGSVILTGTY